MNLTRDAALWAMGLLEGFPHAVQMFAMCMGLFLFFLALFTIAGVMAKFSMWMWPSLIPIEVDDDEHLRLGESRRQD